MVDWGEFRYGLAATRRYLLSHHLPSERDRCYAPTIFGTQYHLCARCVGVYPGVLIGVLAYGAGMPAVLSWVLVVLLPAPALGDWWMTTAFSRPGWNSVRTGTGWLLGCGYGLGLGLLLGHGDLRVLGVAVSYGAIAGGLLYRYHDFLAHGSPE